MDYCFLSNELINDKTKVEIGHYEDWIKWSDHMPLIIDGVE
jgi:endonuclease/exonuclease/phosphatase family metal-dependent hydrolase